MKRTLMMTVAMMFTGQMAFAAIDPQQLADSYVADGYTFVEVKQGPTQTKIEAVKGTTLVEAVYLNETGELISQETQTADAEDAARTGAEIKSTRKDFEGVTREAHDDQADEGEEEHHSGDDGDDDGDDEDSGDGGGNGHGGTGDNGGNSGGSESSGRDCN